jgi:hypothetical protein
MSHLPEYFAFAASMIAVLMSLVAVYVSYISKRRLDETNVLQARKRELPPSANTAEPTGPTPADTGEADE